MESTHKKTELLTILNNKISPIKVAMFTSINMQGNPHCRPMYCLEMDYEGNLWFFTNQYSSKVNEINDHKDVSISYTNTSKDIYVVISGKAALVNDLNLKQDKWKPKLSDWFPKGLKDPKLCLIKVRINSAEYWDIKSTKMIHLFDHIKSEKTIADF